MSLLVARQWRTWTEKGVILDVDRMLRETRTDIQLGDYSRCCCSEAVRLSVCLSVRPSDSSIVSERMHVIVKLSTALVFVSATTVTKFSESPLPAPTRTVWHTATKFGIVVYVGDERISKGSITPIKL